MPVNLYGWRCSRPNELMTLAVFAMAIGIGASKYDVFHHGMWDALYWAFVGLMSLYFALNQNFGDRVFNPQHVAFFFCGTVLAVAIFGFTGFTITLFAAMFVWLLRFADMLCMFL